VKHNKFPTQDLLYNFSKKKKISLKEVESDLKMLLLNVDFCKRQKFPNEDSVPNS